MPRLGGTVRIVRLPEIGLGLHATSGCINHPRFEGHGFFRTVTNGRGWTVPGSSPTRERRAQHASLARVVDLLNVVKRTARRSARDNLANMYLSARPNPLGRQTRTPMRTPASAIEFMEGFDGLQRDESDNHHQ
jgi:hypothetical protein